MSTIESRAKLIQATKKLMADWEQTKETWRDEKGRQFEALFLVPLASNLRAAALAMERMGAMLNSAQHECRDSREGDV